MYPQIIAEMSNRQWFMVPSALRGMLNVLEGDRLSADDYKLFHAAEEHRKLTAFDALGTPVEGSNYSYIRNNIGFLFIDGPIIPRATWFSNISGIVSLDSLTNEFNALKNNPAVEHIVGIFDTPGGDVTGLADFTSVVKGTEKHTVAFVFGMAASAGYFIASGFDDIVSPDGGMVGSIGTVLSMRDFSERDKKNGVKQIEIVSSQSPNKRPDIDTDAGRAVIQQMVDDQADVFVNAVATNRNVAREKVLSDFGQGAMLIAHRALSAGMIDSISTLEGLISSLEKKPAGAFIGNTITLAEDTATVTAEEDNMDGKDDKVLTADEHEAQLASAVKKAQATAVAEERTRVSAIDALATKFTGSHPKVVTAVRACLDEAKTNPEATEATTAVLLLDVVGKAQLSATNDHGDGRRGSADLAGNFANADTGNEEENEAAASEQRVNALVAGFDAMGGGAK